ncbi:helix-hairpin-helix domain-containing protein [Amnibacterium sp. CER49]|uniref:helix-hairpin-helix domain-containing protein n=1 Tax=Amnibacterium sp. CER49 TaxID=3039161 RepID=UPI00244BB9AF|nr:helix-hairpin-helix domain-containing protein [Amnibacterium sp. CER49]MDH2442461.1 helix-hairpin-helix domain-containing protein [Amnibacterium sp. CER49]
MDPLLTKLLPADPRRRRVTVLLGVGAAAIVLAVSVAVAAVGADGSVVRVTAAPRSVVPSPAPSTLLVQVAGAVRHPGVVTVPEGSRALDAIAAAGGTTGSADESQVNLAARVADGQLLLVPTRGAASTRSSAGPPAGAAGPVSLNAATEQQLETLPRIGPATAQRILAWRSAHGGFAKVTDLLQVGGIGPKTLAGLQGLVVP